MHQHINLHQRADRQAHAPLSSRVALAVCGLLIAMAAGYTVLQERTAHTLAAEVTELRARQATLQVSASDAPESGIEREIEVLEASISARQRALEILKTGVVGRTTGFAARLEALGRRHVAGLQIERIVMSGRDGSLDLSGVVLSAHIVPDYLRSLAQDPALDGVRFDDFIIGQPEAVASADGGVDAVADLRQSRGVLRFRAGSRTLLSTAEVEGGP